MAENTCKQCTDNCQKCDGPGEDECTICNDGYYNYYISCKDCAEYNCFKCLRKEWGEVFCTGKCYPGFYVDTNDHDDDETTFKCAFCYAEGCNTCDKDHFVCDSCRPGFVMVNNKCESCQSPCLTCENDPKKCKSCVKEFFFNKEKETCDKCPNNCDECDSATNCLKCKKSFYESNGACINCHESCQICHDGTNSCDQCKTGYFFNSNKQCEKCSTHCQECDINSCFRCEKSKCTECIDGYYLDNGACKLCKSPCATCSSANKCLSCIDGHLLNNFGFCNQRCASNCLNCEANINQCTSCKNGFVLSGTKCVSCLDGCRTCEFYENAICTSCMNDFYLNGEKCNKCDSSCKSCYGTSTSCSTCADGYYFTSMNYEPGSYYTGLCSLCNGTGHENCQQCIENCNDDDKFTCSPNPICTKCQKCNESCKTCTGPTDADCILCTDGYKWIGAVCVNVSNNCLANKHCEFDNSEGTEI